MCRAQNNSQSMDNVRPERQLDRPRTSLAGHVDQSQMLSFLNKLLIPHLQILDFVSMITFMNRKLHKDQLTFLPIFLTGQKGDLTKQKLPWLVMMSCCHPKIILSPDVYGKIYAIVKGFGWSLRFASFPILCVLPLLYFLSLQVAQWTQQVWFYYKEKIIKLTCNVHSYSKLKVVLSFPHF